MDVSGDAKLDDLDLAAISKILRNQSISWQNARAEYDGVKEVPYHCLVRKGKDKAELKKVIGQVGGFLKKQIKGGVNLFLQDKFIIDYELRCNLDNDPVYGCENMNLSFVIKWDKLPVKVRCVPGDCREVIISAELKAIIQEGMIKDLNEFAGLTGLNVEQLRNINASKYLQLLRMFEFSTAGQSKLTRLVKGCLMFLDHLKSGPMQYEGHEIVGIEYNAENLVRALTYEDTAYVFSTNNDDDSAEINAILYGMCEQYPHPVFGGCSNVSIPADAKSIKLVGYKVDPVKTDVIIRAEIVWGVLLQYAHQFSLREDLEAALIIACSLRENKYMSKATLPKVVSLCDLVYPAMTKHQYVFGENTLIDSGGAIMVGRFHQLLNFVMFKDLDASLMNTSVMCFDQNREMRSILSRDNVPLMEYMEDMSVASILKATKAMGWLGSLNDEDMDRLRMSSIFEGFWLVRDPKTVLKTGLIKCLKNGYKNPIGLMQPGLYFDAFSTLRHEVKLGGGDLINIPNGGFNIRMMGIRGRSQSRKVKVLKFELKGREICPWSNQRKKSEQEGEGAEV
nr:putative viral coat protein [Ipomoea trifida]